MERVTSNVKTVKSYLWDNIFFVLALLLLILGIILIATSFIPTSTELPFTYTKCTNIEQEECRHILKYPKPYCQCFLELKLVEPLNGTVSMFYELDTFDQQQSSDYLKSRDDRQLRGDLSQPPSADCGKYARVVTPDGEEKPIAPCGAIADSIFNDTFQLNFDKLEVVPKILNGLEGITEADRQNYRNPPGDLKEAFKNYSKPIDWPKNVWEGNVWEMNESDPANKGLQNEAFIAWMKTDMKRKPAWRVNHTGRYEDGLPAGDYSLRVRYAYPYALYSGERRAILRVVHSGTNLGLLIPGIIFIIVAIGVVAGKLFYNKKKHGEFYHRVNRSNSH